MKNLTDREKANAVEEVRFLASVRHKNVIGYKESFFDEKSSSLCIVMEFADDADLYQMVKTRAQSNAYFQEDFVWKVFIQIVEGLATLHELSILH